MSHRSSVTLIEVLVAIFVMGIGMIGLLALFPLGILRMTGAIEAQKCTEACGAATAIASFQNLRSDTTFYPPSVVSPFSNPWDASLWPAPGQGPAMLPADPDGPSYPVFIDPMGYNQIFGLLPQQFWLTQSGNTIPRRSVSFVQNAASPTTSANHWFTIQNDLVWFTNQEGTVWDKNGTPQFVIPPDPPTQPLGRFNRDTRYAYALMVQRPRTADASVVNLTVAVFNSRALTTTFNEYLYQTNPALGFQEVWSSEVGTPFNPASNTITLDVTNSGNALPPARPGNWLLDASYVPSTTGPYATVNGYFYRIASVTQNSNTSVTYEVQPPLRNFPATNSANAWQKVIFLEGLAEVFEKGPGRLP